MVEAKITEQQREEIIEKFYSGQMKQKDIAKEYGLTQSGVSRIVNDVDAMTKMLRATTAERVRAQIRINNHLMEAVNTQIDLMRGQYEDHHKYLKQNAARDILDRGGVRAEKDEKPEVRITMDFGESGGFTLGVPDHSMDNAVSSMDNESEAE